MAKISSQKCDFCGRPIYAGMVYVLLYAEGPTGQLKWTAAHLECDARRRGAEKVRFRSLPMIVRGPKSTGTTGDQKTTKNGAF